MKNLEALAESLRATISNPDKRYEFAKELCDWLEIYGVDRMVFFENSGLHLHSELVSCADSEL